MAQKIVNIKARQKFIIIDNIVEGFPIGAIVEAQQTIMKCKDSAGFFKLIGGVDKDYFYWNVSFHQQVCELRRFKGKIK